MKSKKLIMERGVWIYAHYFCHCGCNQHIIFRECHRKTGHIPRYLPSHYSKTKEHREQARKLLTGENNPYHRCPELRLVHSQNMIGSGNTFWDKHHTSETKAKLRAHHLGTKQTPETKLKISKGLRRMYRNKRKGSKGLRK